LRYAGTGCSVAAGTLRHFLTHFRAQRGCGGALVPTLMAYQSKHISNSNLLDAMLVARLSAWRPDRPTLEMCLGVISVALGMVMAGTGDLASLRLLRDLRWCIDVDITYGAV